MKSVGFIGGGNMGLALGQAFARRFPEIELFVCDLRPERVARFRESLPAARVTAEPASLAARAEVVFLAVKPQDVAPVLEAIRATDRLVVSIAAGVPLARLERALPGARVVRVMPNTPCLVGAMAAGYACGGRATAEDRRTVEALLGAAGYAAELREGSWTRSRV